MNKAFTNPFLDMSKMFQTPSFGMFDASEFFKINQRNIDAIVNANEICTACCQAIARRSVEILQESVQSATQMISDVAAAPSIDKKIAKQVERSQEALSKAMTDTQEISQLLSKTNREMFEIMQRRAVESVAELRSAAQASAASASNVAPMQAARKSNP